LELYQLRPSTLELVTMLREIGTIGPHNYQRNNGKTTALMIYAWQLLNTHNITGSNVLIYLCNQPQLYRAWYRERLPHVDKQPLFSRAKPYGYGDGSYVLVDEPWSLNFEPRDWDDIGWRYNVRSVGPWYR
jgi:hypothetical protein